MQTFINILAIICFIKLFIVDITVEITKTKSETQKTDE